MKLLRELPEEFIIKFFKIILKWVTERISLEISDKITKKKKIAWDFQEIETLAEIVNPFDKEV